MRENVVQSRTVYPSKLLVNVRIRWCHFETWSLRSLTVCIESSLVEAGQNALRRTYVTDIVPERINTLKRDLDIWKRVWIKLLINTLSKNQAKAIELLILLNRWDYISNKYIFR